MWVPALDGREGVWYHCWLTTWPVCCLLGTRLGAGQAAQPCACPGVRMGTRRLATWQAARLPYRLADPWLLIIPYEHTWVFWLPCLLILSSYKLTLLVRNVGKRTQIVNEWSKYTVCSLNCLDIVVAQFSPAFVQSPVIVAGTALKNIEKLLYTVSSCNYTPKDIVEDGAVACIFSWK